MYKKIEKCRICGNAQLVEVLDLGVQALTGVFPRTRTQKITTGPLKLVKCIGASDVCGLMQLQHSYDLSEMYGLNYGYRSGLNASMVTHLHGKVQRIMERVRLDDDPLIIDIGSNDSTTLQAYPKKGCTLVGIDPTGIKFRDYYPSHVQLIPDFFSSAKVKQHFGDRRARVITSFSMFYDLEAPLAFMSEIYEVLDDQGIWVFEQSYMPTMLETNSYDTVCHEHLEYYALKQIKWMTDRVGFKIVDVEFNDVNGGSFSIAVAKQGSGYAPSQDIDNILKAESEKGFDGLQPFHEFSARVNNNRSELRRFLDSARQANKKVCGLGASTKGNVILQYCGITSSDVSVIGEVNKDKIGCFTPGTLIPICQEDELLATKPDYLLVLPWHFRRFFEGNPKFSGSTLIFPLSPSG